MISARLGQRGDHLDFQKEFLNALQTNTALTKNIFIHDYLPMSLSVPEAVADSLPFFKAYGRIHASFPYYYEIQGLDSYCLIYTESGSGTMVLDKCSYLLTPNKLALIDCQKSHRIDIKQSPWNYLVFFIKGTSLAYLYKTLTEINGNIHTFSPASDIPNLIQKLYIQLDKKPDNYFFHTKMISDILLGLILENNKEKHDNTPLYLTEVKRSFDINYSDSFSLDALEKQYHISKYRLCREFTKEFDISPIQYLNQRRIEAAKEALCFTDKRINEIGRMVGFDNTNHFIRLFKQQTGVTPLIYRKQPPVI